LKAYTKFLVNNLLSSINERDAVDHSFKNYHNVGVNYINLFRDERLTVKVYLLDPLLIKSNQDGFLVNPHNHRYAFSTTVIFGSVSNINFKEVPKETSVNIYQRFDYLGYQENSSFTHYGEVGLEVTEDVLYKPWESYLLDEHTVHTLRLSDEPTGLLLIQHMDTQLDGTRYYGRTLDAPDACKEEGLYQRYNVYEMREHLQYILEKVNQ
jgi:hypothetical protein